MPFFKKKKPEKKTPPELGPLTADSPEWDETYERFAARQRNAAKVAAIPEDIQEGLIKSGSSSRVKRQGMPAADRSDQVQALAWEELNTEQTFVRTWHKQRDEKTKEMEAQRIQEIQDQAKLLSEKASKGKGKQH